MGKVFAEYIEKLNKATASRRSDGIPCVVALAGDGSGKTFRKVQSGSFPGHDRNPKVEPGSRGQFNANTLCWIASCTKMMTTIAVMQCVERGNLNLDDDVGKTWLPEFKEPDVLIRMEDDSNGDTKPVLKKATRKITLRNLLTHTSGLGYEFTHPKLNAWREWAMSSTSDGKDNARSSDIAVAHKVPLMFEPDEGWLYGYGIDWAGLVVMRATKQNLEDYMSENIWEPCKMRSTTFSIPNHRRELFVRYAGMTLRDESGNLSDLTRDVMTNRAERVKYGGGGGCFSTANDYMKFLTSLLRTLQSTGPSSDRHDLVSRATLESMLTQRLGVQAEKLLNYLIQLPLAAGLAGNIPVGVPTTFGLGGIVNLETMPNTSRPAGGIQWSGLPNLFWWINPTDGLCGCFFTQLLPPGDRTSLDLYAEFEAAVNQEWREEKINGKL